MRNHLFPFILLISLILLFIPTQLTLSYFTKPSKLLSPESTVLSAYSNPYPLDPKPYVILGFLPYWLLNQSEQLQYSQLTQIAYFGVEFDSTAQLKTTEDGGHELGLHRLRLGTIDPIIQHSLSTHVAPILVVKILNNAGITAATDPANRSQVITQISQLLTQYSFSGVNIDFEYIGPPPPEIQANFTTFIRELNSKLACPSESASWRRRRETRNLKLSIDVYADTAAKQSQRLWQLAALAPHLDHFVIMGYDFFRSTSPAAGPVAPLRGAPTRWDEDLTTDLRDFTHLVPASQLILGLPFYGYEWSTQTNQPGSVTIGRGSLATYSRVQSLIDSCSRLSPLNPIPCTLSFDPDAFSPYLIYKQNNQINQVWYEDSRSLEYKLQLVKQAGLAGIAIWALGYEAPHPDLWQTISQTLR